MANLEELSNELLADVIVNYKKYGYSPAMCDKALAILKKRPLTEEERDMLREELFEMEEEEKEEEEKIVFSSTDLQKSLRWSVFFRLLILFSIIILIISLISGWLPHCVSDDEFSLVFYFTTLFINVTLAGILSLRFYKTLQNFLSVLKHHVQYDKEDEFDKDTLHLLLLGKFLPILAYMKTEIMIKKYAAIDNDDKKSKKQRK